MSLMPQREPLATVKNCLVLCLAIPEAAHSCTWCFKSQIADRSGFINSVQTRCIVKTGGVTWSKRTITPKKPITWIQGNFPRSWSKGDVPFRHCQKICRHVNAGTQPHCEHTPWMSLFCEVGGWISEESVKPRGWKMEKFFRWKIFTSFPAAERNTQTIFRWKMEAIFRWKVKIFRDTPMETLVMHPANTEDARNGAGQSQTCRVLETPNTLCNRNMSFLLLGFLANFPEYFPEKRVMRNGFFFL